jgi:hypothetical protein
MTRDDIIKMAREAGLTIRGHYDETGSTPSELERFFAVAYAAGAAAEREKWIKALDAEMVSCHLGVFNAGDDPRAALAKLLAWHQDVALDPAVSSGAQNLILKGREVCAKVCETEGARGINEPR